MSRLLERKFEEIRRIEIEPNILLNAEGSCMITLGNTQVICSATIDKSVPMFLKGKGQGWLTAEYNMLPRSAYQRIKRDVSIGKINARSQEIQRLIGRSLRSCIDFYLLGEKSIIIDCDVINADGGTRTASITGGYVALDLAISKLLNKGELTSNPIRQQIAAISCGILRENILVDLDYEEDSKVDVDANFVIADNGSIVEIQISAEKNTFTDDQFGKMLYLAKKAIRMLLDYQKQVCNYYYE